MKKLSVFAVLALATFALLQSPTISTGQDELKYVGAPKCKMCHNKTSSGKFYDDWYESKHANAFSSLKGDERKNPECLKCHTTGYGKPGGFTSVADEVTELKDLVKEMAGVQCEVCHGPGEKHIKSKTDNVIKNAGVPTEKGCVVCHNDTNPHWDPNRYTTADGKKSGFDFAQAIKKVNHAKVKKAE
jgi:hypothetical protein